jgi:hypothetical protein
MPRTREAAGQKRAAEEAERASGLLRKFVQRSAVPVREVERRIGWGQGTLQSVLTGGVALRFDHVAAVAEGCGFSLGDFYRAMAGEEAVVASNQLSSEEVVAVRRMLERARSKGGS